MPSTLPRRPVVFVSYRHDSKAHKARVLQLAQRLRTDGIDVILDQYLPSAPAKPWPRWMLDELERASHVLCVCTEKYYRAFRGHIRTGGGKGSDWEGAIITQALYDARSRNAKFIPVLIKPTDREFIPEPLRGTNCYRIPQNYQALYDAILGQAGVEPAPLGDLKRKPRRTMAEPEWAGGASAEPAAPGSDNPDLRFEQLTNSGSGAIALGPGSVAAGAGSTIVSGDLHGEVRRARGKKRQPAALAGAKVRIGQASQMIGSQVIHGDQTNIFGNPPTRRKTRKTSRPNQTTAAGQPKRRLRAAKRAKASAHGAAPTSSSVRGTVKKGVIAGNLTVGGDLHIH